MKNPIVNHWLRKARRAWDSGDKLASAGYLALAERALSSPVQECLCGAEGLANLFPDECTGLFTAYQCPDCVRAGDECQGSLIPCSGGSDAW